MGHGGVLTSTKGKAMTVSAVQAHSLTFNLDTELCIIRNISSCWYGKKLGLGQVLGLCKEGFGESMVAFTGARKEGHLGPVSSRNTSVIIIRVGGHFISLYQSRNRSIGALIVRLI